MRKKRQQNRPWSEYPNGTKAYAIGGGYWEKNDKGWTWIGGCTFPTPGGDAIWVEFPRQTNNH